MEKLILIVKMKMIFERRSINDDMKSESNEIIIIIEENNNIIINV